MIELVIKNYLDGHLDVPSFFEHQNGFKGKYVLVEKLSFGTIRNNTALKPITSVRAD